MPFLIGCLALSAPRFAIALVVIFSARGFAALDNGTTIMLKRNGVPADSVVITKTGMVQQ